MLGEDARVPWNDPGPARLFDIAEAEHFIVYIDRDMKVAWATSPEFASAAGKEAPYDPAALAAIMQDIERLDAQHDEALATTRRFKDLLGDAAKRAFAHDYQGARESLRAAGGLVPAPDATDVDAQWRHVTGGDDYKYYVAMTKDYIVYVDPIDDVAWETTPAYDRDTPRAAGYDQAALNSITNQVEVMSATPSEGFTPETIRRFKKLLGAAVACALDLDYASGRQMLADAQKYIRARSEETSRFWYLVACLLVTLPFALFGLLLWLLRDHAMPFLGPIGFWITLGAAAGAIGALLSVIWRSGKLQFDSTAGQLLHYLEGTSRIVAGAISGLLASLAVKSGLILGTLTERADRTNVVLLVAALAAGWGERLATSIISTFEATQIKGVGKDDDKDEGDDKDGGKNKKNPTLAPRPAGRARGAPRAAA